jgi:hypothetical protein
VVAAAPRSRRPGIHWGSLRGANLWGRVVGVRRCWCLGFLSFLAHGARESRAAPRAPSVGSGQSTDDDEGVLEYAEAATFAEKLTFSPSGSPLARRRHHRPRAPRGPSPRRRCPNIPPAPVTWLVRADCSGRLSFSGGKFRAARGGAAETACGAGSAARPGRGAERGSTLTRAATTLTGWRKRPGAVAGNGAAAASRAWGHGATRRCGAAGRQSNVPEPGPAA